MLTIPPGQMTISSPASMILLANRQTFNVRPNMNTRVYAFASVSVFRTRRPLPDESFASKLKHMNIQYRWLISLPWIWRMLIWQKQKCSVSPYPPAPVFWKLCKIYFVFQIFIYIFLLLLLFNGFLFNISR